MLTPLISERLSKVVFQILLGVGMTATTNAAPPSLETLGAVAVPSVVTHDQRAGVTAGYVNTLNATMLPSLVRGPQLAKLKSLFTEGAKLRREFNFPGDDQHIDGLCQRFVDWVNGTANWLGNNVSEYAAERFLFEPEHLSFVYNLPGTHRDGIVDQWGNCRARLVIFLTNLDQLMRDPSIYPEP